MLQAAEDSERVDRQHEYRQAAPDRMMPMDAYRHGDRLVVHVDLLDVDPETVALTWRTAS